MTKLNSCIRAIVALGLLTAAPAVFAQSAYSSGGNIQVGTQATTGVALGPQGQVVVQTQVGVDYGGALNGMPNTTLVDNYITGANGVGLTAFGPQVYISQYGYHAGAPDGYAFDSYTGTFNTVAVGSNGIASNLINAHGDEDEGYGGIDESGVVTNTNTGAITYTGEGTQVAAINSANAVAGTLYAGAGGLYKNAGQSGSPNGYEFSQYEPVTGPKVPAGVYQVPIYESASAPSIVAAPGFVNSPVLGAAINVLTPTILPTLGFGGYATAINATGQVAGSDFMSSQNAYPAPATEAFVTARNGGAVTYLGTNIGTDVGEYSVATSIDNAGAVGGYIFDETTGTMQGFISDPTHGNALDPVSVPGDTVADTEVLYLNNDGQAIIWDMDTNQYYLDSGGTEYNVASLFSPSALAGYTIDGVAGLNDSGQILLDVSSSATGDPAVLSSLTGTLDPTTGTSVESTVAFTDFQSQGGAAPATPYFSAPPSSSVPEPGTLGLMGLGVFALGAGLFGRKRTMSGVVGI